MRASIRPPRRLATRLSRQRGVASLVVVMLLLFLTAMVGAYAARSMVFEQRMSVNHYRLAQAESAAEAALDMTFGLLNAGRIDGNCQPTLSTGPDTLRGRHLVEVRETFSPFNYLGGYRPGTSPSGSTLAYSCVQSGSGWRCECPSAAIPAVPAAPVAGVIAPAFRVDYATAGGGAVRLHALACTSSDCLSAGGPTNSQDSIARYSVVAVLSPSLPSPPLAALTVRGNAQGSAAAVVVNEAQEAGGLVVHSGGVFDLPAAQVSGPAGSFGAVGVADNDSRLFSRTADGLFHHVFRAEPAAFKARSTTLRIPCAGGLCWADVENAWTMNPRHTLWVEGPLVIPPGAQLGTVDQPALVIVEGPLEMAPTARVEGLVYVRMDTWAADTAGSVRGALIVGGHLQANAMPVVTYDHALLQQIRYTFGDMVRVPGSFRSE